MKAGVKGDLLGDQTWTLHCAPLPHPCLCKCVCGGGGVGGGGVGLSIEKGRGDLLFMH